MPAYAVTLRVTNLSIVSQDVLQGPQDSILPRQEEDKLLHEYAHRDNEPLKSPSQKEKEWYNPHILYTNEDVRQIPRTMQPHVTPGGNLQKSLSCASKHTWFKAAEEITSCLTLDGAPMPAGSSIVFSRRIRRSLCCEKQWRTLSV